ncbi:MAG: TonB-dependent receptor, partial [Nitrospirae bacterium]|nr:TonB-dependent receptor [Nitrospirota bacterium]
MKKAWIAVAALVTSAFAASAYAQQADVQLKEVVVTATKTEKDPQDVTQSVTVLTGAAIKRSGAVNVSEAVRTATGVAVSDQGPIGALTTATIRGANYSQVLVLLDGIRMNSPRDGGVDLSALPVSLDDIDRIEIVRGPGSALYGADAMGGVVNIITKQPGALAVNRIGGAMGSHGYDTIQVGTSGRQGASRYAFSAERETSDGYRTNSDLEQWTVGGRLGYDLGKAAALDLAANYISKENGLPGNLQFYETPLARQGQRTLVTGAVLKGRLNKELDVKVSAAVSEDMLRAQDPQSHIVTFGSFTSLVPPVNSLHESRSQRSEVQANWVAAPWSIFTLGYELRRDSLDSTDSGNHTTANHAWYLQDEIPAGDSLIF